ncbi:hypothetical protein C8Q80DRAFT_579909 [Daedaleopsis nitida]|nr:hypothetical protein C8Q80DRAFT_579909 [Daedaleopsis nitida]
MDVRRPARLWSKASLLQPVAPSASALLHSHFHFPAPRAGILVILACRGSLYISLTRPPREPAPARTCTRVPPPPGPPSPTPTGSPLPATACGGSPELNRISKVLDMAASRSLEAGSDELNLRLFSESQIHALSQTLSFKHAQTAINMVTTDTHAGHTPVLHATLGTRASLGLTRPRKSNSNSKSPAARQTFEFRAGSLWPPTVYVLSAHRGEQPQHAPIQHSESSGSLVSQHQPPARVPEIPNPDSIQSPDEFGSGVYSWFI